MSHYLCFRQTLCTNFSDKPNILSQDIKIINTANTIKAEVLFFFVWGGGPNTSPKTLVTCNGVYNFTWRWLLLVWRVLPLSCSPCHSETLYCHSPTTHRALWMEIQSFNCTTLWMEVKQLNDRIPTAHSQNTMHCGRTATQGPRIVGRAEGGNS